MSRATPKAALTLFSRENGDLKFVHSPSAAGDVSLKHKFGNKLTLGVGFTVRRFTARDHAARTLPAAVAVQAGPIASGAAPFALSCIPKCIFGSQGRALKLGVAPDERRAACLARPSAAADCAAPPHAQDATVRKIRSVPGLVLSGDFKVPVLAGLSMPARSMHAAALPLALPGTRPLASASTGIRRPHQHTW